MPIACVVSMLLALLWVVDDVVEECAAPTFGAELVETPFKELLVSTFLLAPPVQATINWQAAIMAVAAKMRLEFI